MPRLNLTKPQVQRLWNLDPSSHADRALILLTVRSSTAATLKLDRTGRPFNLLDFNGACHRFPIRAKATTQYLGDESVDPRQSLSAYPPPRYR